MNEKTPTQGLSSHEVVDANIDWSYSNVTPEKITELKEAATAKATASAGEMLENRDISFGGTIGRMYEIDDALSLASRQLYLVQDLHPDKAARDAADTAYTELLAFETDLNYREDIHELLKVFSESHEASTLKDEEARLLDHMMRGYRRLGFDLDQESRQELASIKKLISEKTSEFSRNVREDTTSCSFTKEQLIGVSESCLDRLEQTDDGLYIVSIASPEYAEIAQKASNRDVRKEAGHTAQTRLLDTNIPLIEEVTALRQKTASILGYESWAHFKLEERMAKTPDAVHNLFDQLVPGLTEKARHETAALEAMLHADGHDGPIQSYDLTYYGNKQREQEYTLDQEKIAEYFPLENTLRGLFDINGAMFGITIEESENPDIWHEDVRTYSISDNKTNEKIADLCMDLFPREGKYKHFAALMAVTGRELPDGSYRAPMSVMMANFTKPTDTKPSLLRHDEVETLFHEFGHQLHHTLTKARYSSFAGSQTERDFVEAPSQINENWAWDEDVLSTMSGHYQTGEPLSGEMIKNLRAARHHNAGINTLTQVSLGKYDLLIHGPDEITAVDAWKQASSVRATPSQEGAFAPATVGHFMSGYDAGYYGYLWAQSLGDDLYSRFRDEGVLSPEVGMRWREHIYEKGGTEDAIDLVRGFLEREPNGDAFLRKLSLTAVNNSPTEAEK